MPQYPLPPGTTARDLAERFVSERILAGLDDPSVPVDRESILDDIEDALILAGDPDA